MITAVILTGGKSKRFGEDKCAYKIKEFTFTQIVYQTLSQIFEKVIQVGNSYLKDVFTIEDEKEGLLKALITTLEYLKEDIFVVGCDMPFLKKEVIQYMKNLFLQEKPLALIAKVNEKIQPLHAFYSFEILDFFKEKYQKGHLSMRKNMQDIETQIKIIEINSRSWKDSFININTKDELRRFINIYE